MKKVILFISLFVTCINLFSQSEFNQIVIDEMIDEEILLGYCDLDGLTSDPFNIWFEPEYESYQIDQESLDQINPELLNELEVKMVLGTWCGDSQREVPRFYKIADYLNFDNISIMAVNASKRAEGTKVSELGIQWVPTFIIYYKGKEIGRIVESPDQSLEKDLLQLLSSI